MQLHAMNPSYLQWGSVVLLHWSIEDCLMRYQEGNRRNMHAWREAVGAGLPRLILPKTIGIPCKKEAAM